MNKADCADERRFHCQCCGNCCRVPGYVALTEGEVERIAAFLKMDLFDFTEQYTVLLPGRGGLSLRSKDDESCIFLQADNSCRIQSVKPGQCRDFPFGWREERILRHCPAWSALW